MGTLIINQYLSKLWTPAEMTTALWLDAADSSTVTESSGLVSQWDDKSGNSRHVTQATTINQPTYNLANKLIEFGANLPVFLDSPTLNFTQEGNILFVAEQLNLDGLATYVGSSNNASRWQMYNSSSNNFFSMFAGVALQSVVTSSTQKYIHHGQFNQANSNYFIDGQVVASGNVGTDTLNNIRLGKDEGLANTNTGFNLHEFILVGSSLTLSTRQKLEGYFAHKWGLTSSLSITHPYKNTPPYV